jgi:hypothetical protein
LESSPGQAILAENIRGLFQFFHANSWILSRLRQGRFLPNAFQIIIIVIITIMTTLPFEATCE